MDADEECLRSLVEIIDLNCQLVGYRRPNGFIANSFIAVIPESAIMRETFETSVANVLNKSSQNLFLVTGPPVLTAVLKRYLPLSDVTILTCEEYYSLAKIHGPGLLPYKRQQHWSKLQKKFSIFKSLQEWIESNCHV